MHTIRIHRLPIRLSIQVNTYSRLIGYIYLKIGKKIFHSSIQCCIKKKLISIRSDQKSMFRFFSFSKRRNNAKRKKGIKIN